SAGRRGGFGSPGLAPTAATRRASSAELRSTENTRRAASAGAGAAATLEYAGQLLDVLGAIYVGDQQRIWRVDNDQSADSQECYGAVAAGTHQVPSRIHRHDLAGEQIAVGIMFPGPELIDGLPAPDIAPTEIALGDQHPGLGSFHNSVVNRNRFEPRIDLFQNRLVAGFPDCVFYFADARVQLWSAAFQLRHDGPGSECKEPVVPEVSALRQVAESGLAVGFFHKPIHAKESPFRSLSPFIAHLDVAIACLGASGRDSDCNDGARSSRLGRG